MQDLFTDLRGNTFMADSTLSTEYFKLKKFETDTIKANKKIFYLNWEDIHNRDFTNFDVIISNRSDKIYIKQA